MNEKQRFSFEPEFYITFNTRLCSGDALHISSQEMLKLGPPAQSPTSPRHRASLLWTIRLVVLWLPWCDWPHLHNAVLPWHKWFLWYISIKNEVGSDHENVDARQLYPHGCTMYMENCCSTNFALGMKSGLEHHCAETPPIIWGYTLK